jgi:hypothetical protein
MATLRNCTVGSVRPYIRMRCKRCAFSHIFSCITRTACSCTCSPREPVRIAPAPARMARSDVHRTRRATKPGCGDGSACAQGADGFRRVLRDSKCSATPRGVSAGLALAGSACRRPPTQDVIGTCDAGRERKSTVHAASDRGSEVRLAASRPTVRASAKSDKPRAMRVVRAHPAPADRVQAVSALDVPCGKGARLHADCSRASNPGEMPVEAAPRGGITF